MLEVRKEYIPPSECVPFFKQFEIGQDVRILYNGGLAYYEVEGILMKIDSPSFVIRKYTGGTFNATMGDIMKVVILNDNDAQKQRIQEELLLEKQTKVAKDRTEAIHIVKQLKETNIKEREQLLNQLNYKQLKHVICQLVDK